MSAARFLVGDVFEQMGKLPDSSVDLVLTSPPFLALRSYLPADHPDKDKEIGSEPDPAAFLDTLLALTAEWGRLLAPHGSIAVELGDTYSGSGGAGGDYGEAGLRAGGQPRFRAGYLKADGRKNGQLAATGEDAYPVAAKGGAGWPLPKSLCGIPHLYHLSLAYGRNLLTGEPSPAGRWRVRNVVAWCRPNPPVGALGDKYRPATSYMTVACQSGSRYFDLDAVRQPHAVNPDARTVQAKSKAVPLVRPGVGPRADGKASGDGFANAGNPAGAPPNDWWEIPTQPYAGAHYATWPTALCERPIKSMVPRRVCTVCGRPSTRLVDVQGLSGKDILATGGENDRGVGLQGKRPPMPEITRTTTGWSDCGHDSWRNGMVLDPFAGSGTTLAVATGHGRDAIGIDLDARNAELAYERVGMFLEVEP